LRVTTLFHPPGPFDYETAGNIKAHGEKWLTGREQWVEIKGGATNLKVVGSMHLKAGGGGGTVKTLKSGKGG